MFSAEITMPQRLLRLMWRFTNNAPRAPLSALSHEEQLTRTLRTVYTRGPLSFDMAAYELCTDCVHAKRLLETLFMNGSLAKYMNRGVLYYKLHY